MPIVNLQEVKDRLRIDEAASDQDLSRMIVEAEDIVLDYVGRTLSPIPDRVRTAILLVIQTLYDGTASDPLTVAVRSILSRTRKLALA